jgi:predicted ArsR family transcriptional regulator
MYEVRQDILEVAKALGEETRFNIFRRIADAPEPLTVKDLVEQLGMHHSAIRIHLNKLEDAGLIYSRKRHNPGVVGRPQLAFLPREEALSITLPPRNYEFLSRLALDMIEANGSAESPEEFGMRWGRDYIRDRGKLVDGPLPLEEALGTLVEELHVIGTAPRLTTTPRGWELAGSNCVFQEVAASREPFVCKLHQSVLEGMLAEISADEFEWAPKTRICDGGDNCAIRISPITAD